MVEEENQKERERKVYGIGIKMRIIALMKDEGFEDVSDYIDALIQRIKRLQQAREQIQNDLQQANQTIEQLEAKLKEYENAK
jgi:phage shock protein A